MSDLEFEFAATALAPLDDEELAILESTFRELEGRATEVLDRQEVPEEARRIVRTLDVRYRGQEHTLSVEYRPGDTAADVLAAFNAQHLSRHGHAMDEPGQILSVRLRAVGVQPKPPLVRIASGSGSPEAVSSRRLFDVATDAWVDAAVYDRHSLLARQTIAGPAIVEEGTSTTVFFSDQELLVNEYGHLAISLKGAAS
nr:hypothetical protein [Microbacterium excoecariae]